MASASTTRTEPPWRMVSTTASQSPISSIVSTGVLSPAYHKTIAKEYDKYKYAFRISNEIVNIIVKEMMPNLMPFIVAVFITTVSAAILASIGLEALGLGAFESNTLGMTIYWNIWYASLINGWWWWWTAPVASSACTGSLPRSK